MNTDALIDAIVARGSTEHPGSIRRRYTVALAAGIVVTALVMLSALGPRHDFAHAIALPMFWVKLAFVASLAILGTVAAFRSGLPGRRLSAPLSGIAVVITGIGIVAIAALAESPPAARTALLLGNTWKTCPWLVAGLSVPLCFAIASAMRGMAPTHPRRAGALAGFASGATAALVYAFHCPELAAPFIGTWYVLGMLVPTIAGALLGPRLFRW